MMEKDLNEESMRNFPSWRSYWNFAWSVRRDLRYVRTAESDAFLNNVRVGAAARKVALEKGTILWRAQLGHDWRSQSDSDEYPEVPCPHPPDRMRPLRDRASEGRANPKGIPYLYLATTKETAMSEVRPWVGSEISVGQFRLLESLCIIDCSRNHNDAPIYLEEPAPEDRERAVWAYIDRAFAEPTTRGDGTADYVPTQIIAELFKTTGYDGVAYKSNFGEKGFNIALFNIDAAEILNCGLYCVDKIDMTFSETANPYVVNKSTE